MLLIPLSNISSNRADRDLKEDACLCQEVSAPLWGPVGQIHELRPRGRRQPEIAVSQIKRILRRHSLSLSLYLPLYLPTLPTLHRSWWMRPAKACGMDLAWDQRRLLPVAMEDIPAVVQGALRRRSGRSRTLRSQCGSGKNRMVIAARRGTSCSRMVCEHLKHPHVNRHPLRGDTSHWSTVI